MVSLVGFLPRFQLSLVVARGCLPLSSVGILLAISSGYASPVFPLAALAIAVAPHFGLKILPAIWFGSLILNIGIALSHGPIFREGKSDRLRLILTKSHLELGGAIGG